MIKQSLKIFALLTFALYLSANAQVQTVPSQSSISDVTVASEWIKLLYNRIDGEGFYPPTAARIYAYAGITLYEAIVPGMTGKASLSSQLTDMPTMPQGEAGMNYDWPSVANAAVSKVINELMAASSDTALKFTASRRGTSKKVATLRQEFIESRTEVVGAEVVTNSLIYGEKIAEAILSWAADDNYDEIRDMNYTAPTGSPSLWVPRAAGRDPIDPYWGNLRPFTLGAASDCKVMLELEFSTDPDSAFYQAALEVYNQSFDLSEDQRSLAMFWDDMPSDTGTHAGHWLMIATSMTDKLDLELNKAAELYAILSITLGDAFISAWSTKYEDLLIRPNTYINRYIDPDWQPVLDTPNFPDYPSGHSVAGGAAAEVLTVFLGELTFDDQYGWVDDMWSSRTFDSFKEAAAANAMSRFYGGVHYKVSVLNGVKQGECVGKHVLKSLKNNISHNGNHILEASKE